MKKLGKLSLKPEKMLNQEELVNFRGGSGGGSCGQSGSTCQIYIRSNYGAGPGYWTEKLYTVSEAQCHYNTPTTWYPDYQTTGYCCASC